MKYYCLVENGKITDGPRKIPTSWRNISGLNLCPEPDLIKKGWLPVEYGPEPDYDPMEQKVETCTPIIKSDTVIYPKNIVDLSEDEKLSMAIAAEKNTDFLGLVEWEKVAGAIDGIANIAEAKVILKKMAKVLYWLAKQQVK